MSAAQGSVSVTIMGRELKLSVPPGEEARINAAVEHLNQQIDAIRRTGKVVGNERLAVLAALNIAHELLSTKVGKSVDLGDAKRRIAAMQAKLDQALAGQEKLF